MQKWLNDSVESFNAEAAKFSTPGADGEASSSTPGLTTPFGGALTGGMASLLSAAPNFEAVTEKLGALTPGLSLDPTQAFTDAPAQKDETQALRERVAELERSEARANEKMQMLEEELHAALDAAGGGTTTTPAAAKKTPMLTLPLH